MTRKIHLPYLVALVYTGEFSKKLFEVRSEKTPILEKGDYVIVDKLSGSTLKRRGFFTEVNIEDIFDNETSQTSSNDEKSELSKIVEYIKANFTDELEEVAGADISFADIVISLLEKGKTAIDDTLRADGTQRVVLTDADALADLNGEPRPDNPSVEATAMQEAEKEKEPSLKPLAEFEDDKDALEVYGKEFGIDLDKRKTPEDMYAELVEFLKASAGEKDPEDEAELAVPFKEDIETLSEDDIKKWCEHFKIKIGRKQLDTLKGLLLPYLQNKED